VSIGAAIALLVAGLAIGAGGLWAVIAYRRRQLGASILETVRAETRADAAEALDDAQALSDSEALRRWRENFGGER